MSRETIKEIKKPDLFIRLSAYIMEFIFRHRMALLALILVLFGIGLGFTTYHFFKQNQNYKANQLLFEINQVLDKKKEEIEKSKKAKTPDVLKSEYADTTARLEKLVQDYTNTAAGAEAALILNNLYQQYDMPQAAQEVLKKAIECAQSGLLKGLLIIQMGAIQAQHDCKQAIETWTPLTQDPLYSYLQGDVLLRLGVCFEDIGQKDKAKEYYENAIKTSPSSNISQTARKFIRNMDITNK